jgi:hypothetical protein
MPYFLKQTDAYRILQRELPEGVYADGPPTAFYTTSDMDSVAKIIGDAYENLNVIYDNFWPQTMLGYSASGEQINAWEIREFGQIQDTTQNLETRIANLLTKIQSIPAINAAYIASLIQSLLGPNIGYNQLLVGGAFEIIEWGNYTGSWMIGVSELGIDTFLSGGNRYQNTGSNICPPAPLGTPPPNGISETELSDEQQTAYTYEVRIYGTTLSSSMLAKLNVLLSANEPARSTHVITDGLDPSTMITLPTEADLLIFLEQGGSLTQEDGSDLYFN